MKARVFLVWLCVFAFVIGFPAGGVRAAAAPSSAVRGGTAPVSTVHPMLVLPTFSGAASAAPSSGGGGSGCSSTFPTPTGTAFSPTQIRTAYDWSSKYVGKGFTIGIIDAYSSGTELNDLNCFDAYYRLPTASLTIAQPFGPAPLDPTGGWGTEISLDIEWAHVMAPSANLLLVETPNATTSLVIGQAVPWAIAHGATIISMSFGSYEFNPTTGTNYCSQFQALDSAVFQKYWGQTSSSVSFVAASGDQGGALRGRYGGLLSSYPATSDWVTAVGGTYLTLTSRNKIQSETAWYDSSGATGGGQSICFPVPAPQFGDFYSPEITLYDGVTVQHPTGRAFPDVALDASGLSAYWIYDSSAHGPCQNVGTVWCWVGGTSAGAPEWAGIIADLRATGDPNAVPLYVTEATYDLNLTSVPSYHDITTGTNNWWYATKGWDATTGMGTPDIYEWISQFDSILSK